MTEIYERDKVPPEDPATAAVYDRRNGVGGLLDQCVATYQHWLHLPDPKIVVATVAAAAANILPGDPLWLLIVGPPSSAKTESLMSLAGLPYVHPAATVSPAALLSGTPPKERAVGAKGGLLRHVGDFGILLLKDFTSVLTMQRDARAEALSALREIYDGSWARPVGTAGGMVLEWSGKCGLIGGCTPSIDRHHAVMGALGERFLLYRVTIDDPANQAKKRLKARSHETAMRADLARVVGGLLDHIGGTDRTPTADAIAAADPIEDDWVVDLAVFTAAVRTPVERDGYDREVVVMPETEGPARIATQLGAMRDGLIAVGATTEARHTILYKLARDAMPTMRRKVLDALHDRNGWIRRADVMDATGIPRAPVERELEDLVLIGLADREKTGIADNAAWQYSLSATAHELWPNAAPICREGAVEGVSKSLPLSGGDISGQLDEAPVGALPLTAISPAPCRVCNITCVLADASGPVHPTCLADEDVEQ